MENNIVLIGYMGCGKSSVGRMLATQNNMDFMDLDDYIESKEAKSIKDIFTDKGEVYFRKIEKKYLIECLEQNASSVYLQTSIGELSNRLFDQRAKRPLIAHTNTKEELSEFIAKHVFERLNFYAQAEFKVITDAKSLAEVVAEIETNMKV